jgi:hypothetical protein
MWADLAELDAANRRVFASYLSVVGERKPSIPYGLNSEGISFDPNTGELLPHPDGRGLTCATFLLALMKTFGHTPIDESSWPISRPGDAEWRQWVVEELQKCSPQHADAVRRDQPCARFRPAEVVGASATNGWPHSCAEAESAAIEVITDLQAAPQ